MCKFVAIQGISNFCCWQGQEGGRKRGRVREESEPGSGTGLPGEEPCGKGPPPEAAEAIAPPGPSLPRWVLPTSPDSFCWTWKVYECGYVSKGLSVCVEGSLLRGHPHGGCFWVLVSLAGRIHGHGIA